MLIFNGVFNQIYFTLFSKILVKYFAYIADFSNFAELFSISNYGKY